MKVRLDSPCWAAGRTNHSPKMKTGERHSSPSAGLTDTIRHGPRHTIVKLGHKVGQVGTSGLQDLKVLQRAGSQITDHRCMRDLVAATVLPIRVLEAIKFDTKLGRQAVKECLSLDICVDGLITLRSSSCLRAINVIAIFVIDVDTIKVLGIDNVNEACGELFLLAKAVVPAIICARTIMIIRWNITFNTQTRDSYRDLPDQEPPMPAPPKLRMTFFPAALHKLTRGWLFALLQIGTVGATAHFILQAFFICVQVYDTAKAMTMQE